MLGSKCFQSNRFKFVTDIPGRQLIELVVVAVGYNTTVTNQHWWIVDDGLATGKAVGPDALLNATASALEIIASK
jgi:hypothetical protein